jgi:hypothetical protein
MFGTRLLQKCSYGGARALEEELLLGASALDLKTARTPLLHQKTAPPLKVFSKVYLTPL